MASSFKYPDITRSEIIGYLAHFGFASNVTEQDLLNPTRELVENIYTHLLNYLDLIQEDDEQADFAALEVFHNPDLHVSTVPVMNLLHKMRGLLAAIDCPGQFTLWDLIKPDPDRTKLFLGSLLNFCTHRTIKMDELTSLAGELDVFVEQKQALEEKLSQLNAEITQCNELRAREALLVQEEEAKVKELKQTIAGLNNHQVSLKSETRKMKERAQELDELTSNVEFELVQSAQENAHLRYKIVQSPDKLQRALEEKKSHQVEAKNTERAAMQAFQDKNATLELYTKALKKMSKSLEQMKAIQEQANSVKSVEKEIKALKCKLGEDEMLDKSLDAKLVEKQGKADQLDEMKKKVEIECILAREEATKELNNVKSQVESTRNGLLLRKKQVETVIAEGDAVNAKIISVGENAESQCQQLKLKHEEVAKEFMMYSNKVGDVLKRYRVDPPTQQ
ncbi:unnamed protein product [Cuscuta europaea]|uniref:Kinetochore protein Nuf2 N-terminal domain-containing protein n=1 Tax=Cuscuta europaea TaxID=41803 RepID=A0A9P0Z0D8_CUSEU|nr:unnamed protein product [Cuscuta europaea]